MSHTFLLQPSSWIIKGNLTEKNHISIPFKGATIITWDQSSWFIMKTKLVFDNNQSSPEIAKDLEFEYKGFLPNNKYSYSYVLKRSDFDKIEGEGWITKNSIIQRYWILGDSRRRSVLETMFQLDEDHYHFSSTMVAGNNIVNVTEGILERHG
ncbi:hypothetical protein AA637_01025 [Cyanobacterium sp. HL-69]|uniref:hypothetical protein n=1 Tax=unclassified Cyanobacterium TaxID=2629879 RepID=UPI0008524C11|nr:hypothetical protein [Cyanobacterium sp. IPPAS B-1200]AUC59810.1 hypothetical protein AA637_01025 [Cyanobacterium sp. HL-69]OEJ79222.1 hypothetical protein A5482_10765 [Cyanobacterium sp. IPPAS B-1200]